MIARRKGNLELQLFKKKYARISKHIGYSGGSAKMNPFTAPHKPSVFSEAISDPKMDIRSNRELFENVIKNAVKEVRDSKEEINPYAKALTED